MWSQYIRSGEGFAIKSSYQKLIKSISTYADFEVYIGLIKYLDYDVDVIPVQNLLTPFMCKRKSFEHEKEIRCLIWTPQHGKNDFSHPDKNVFKNSKGLRVGVSLDHLIDEIYISPNSPEWVGVESSVKCNTPCSV
jgi:hypothetical protein